MAILVCHAATPCEALTSLESDAVRDGARLKLRYRARGDIGKLKVPVAVAPARADGLWQHTCFEAFVRAAQGDAYHEFNFAPSGAWAAYRFDSPRQGMTNASLRAPQIETTKTESELILETAVDLDGIAALAVADWRIGLSAVIEEMSGRKSYWALVHPQAKPDFHAPDCFTLELPASVTP